MKFREKPIVVGQVWQDWDVRIRRRLVPRLLRVVEIDRHFALMEDTRTGRRWAIQIKRLRPNSTGYRLVSEP
jgi:hypothetical protein